MNVFKPLMIFNITDSITIMTDGTVNFRKFLIEGTQPNLKKINEYVERSRMRVTALSPVIGYDKASKIATTPWTKISRSGPRLWSLALSLKPNTTVSSIRRKWFVHTSHKPADGVSGEVNSPSEAGALVL